MVRRPRLRQGGAQRAHRVVGARAAIVERHAEEVELLAQRPDADTDDRATARDHVERAVPLGDREWVVVAEHENVGREPDRVRDRAECTERRERIEVTAAAHFGDVDGHGDVLAARAVVVTEPVGLLHDRDDVGERRRLLPLRVRVGGASARE